LVKNILFGTNKLIEFILSYIDLAAKFRYALFVKDYCKLVVFVPRSHLEKVRQAVCSAGAGKIGTKYDCCSFITEGTGTFRPLKGAKPFIGQAGKLAKVKEARLETIVAKKELKKVIAAMRTAHPYEEPAFDLIPLLSPS
jgi:hypothetical protein